MRRVSIGMIEAVLLIKYRNTQPDSTAVLRKEYRSTLRTVLQYFLRSTGRCLSHLSKSLLPRPGRVPWRLLASLLGIGVTAWCILYGIVPRQLFPAPCSTLLYSAEGELLGARIAPDGQWRFPAADSLPDRFVDCLLTYEDKRFFYHPGIDPAAIVRAIRLNGKAGRVVSGGSTLTMQLARIARGNQDRTFYEKTIEMCWALFLETTYSKQEILNLYASHAPFGGNVIGLETAAWRYFGRSASRSYRGPRAPRSRFFLTPRLDPPREKPETTEGEAGSLIGFPSKERCIGRDRIRAGLHGATSRSPSPFT